MTVLWHCPDCRLPVRLSLATESRVLTTGRGEVRVDRNLAMAAHSRQHAA